MSPSIQHGTEQDRDAFPDDQSTKKEVALHTETLFEQAQLRSELDDYPVWQAFRRFKRVSFICFLAGFSAITDGYTVANLQNVIANLGFLRQFGIHDVKTNKYVLDPTWVSVIGAMPGIGNVVGQFSISFVSDRFGRKIGLYVFMLLLTICVALEVSATAWYHFALAKLFDGLAIGSMQATLTVYINELAPTQIRGLLIVALNLWNGIGGLISSIMYTVLAKNHPYSWLPMAYSQFGTTAISFLILFWMPESPWYLMRVGKTERARKNLSFMYKNVPEYDLDKQMSIIASTIELERQAAREDKQEGFFAVVRGLNGKRFLIGAWPKLLQLFVGLSIYGTYSTYFFQLAGFANAFQIKMIQTAVGLVGVPFDMYFVEKLGRRTMILTGFTGICSGMLLLAICTLTNYQGNKALGGVMTFAGVMANFFATFQTTTSYAVLTECAEVRFRARAAGWGLAYINVFGVAISYMTPQLIAKWGPRCVWFFVCLGIPCTIATWFFLPETGGRTPAEINELFQDRVSLRKWKGYKTKVEQDLESRRSMQQTQVLDA